MYFVIVDESDPKIIGVKDGMNQLHLNENSFINSNDYEKFMVFFEGTDYMNNKSLVPDFNVPAIKVFLRKSAKVTDFMTHDCLLLGMKYIVSSKIHTILKKLNLKGVNFYPVKIYSDNIEVDGEFFLMQILHINYDGIIFDKSVLVKNLHFKPEVIPVRNLEEYLETDKLDGLCQFKKLTLDRKKLYNDELINPRVSKLFISELLKDIFVQENVTGIEIVETNILEVE